MPSIPAIAALWLLLSSGLASAATDDYGAAQQLHKQGQNAEALRRLDTHLDANPRDARARFLKGVILTDAQRTDEAVSAFTELTQEFPELPEPYNNLAVIYAARGNYARARELLETAVRAFPGYATAQENLGDIYALLAAQAYEKAAESDKTSGTAQRKRATIQALIPTQGPLASTAAAEAPAVPPVPARAAVASAAVSGSAQSAGASPAPDAAEEITPTMPRARSEVASDDAARILAMVEAWAAAWSRNDAATYLSFYAPSFRSSAGESRTKWEKARRERFARGASVTVTVSDGKVTFSDRNHAVVTFRQDYASATLRRSGRKTLELVRSGDRWLITRESIGKG